MGPRPARNALMAATTTATARRTARTQTASKIGVLLATAAASITRAVMKPAIFVLTARMTMATASLTATTQTAKKTSAQRATVAALRLERNVLMVATTTVTARRTAKIWTA